ncbi:ABC transporter ATP-binding protein [Nitrospiraceae bacterium AH_259_D15_M11_P09]|nr:ABC transporter ATP-binding protein [Nitrospiraceae bacterium AH_259_D15_M11_P09]
MVYEIRAAPTSVAGWVCQGVSWECDRPAGAIVTSLSGEHCAGCSGWLGVVRLDHVSKSYDRGGAVVTALRDVSLSVSQGEFCALMGPSGCGKSTLLHLVAGLDAPTSGEIILGGRSAKNFTDTDWTTIRRELIGMVFQSFHLIPSLTAEENVALPLLLKGEGGSPVRDRVAEHLDVVGMQARAKHRPGELSGGEQQRVAIARALVHRPQVILADEPTGNLDSTRGSEIIALLRSLPKRFGQAIILVTHSPDAARQADTVHMMRDGQLDARAT